ncbi:MAG: HDOD domain-containing protein [Desulfuromonas sp.]|nr:HDOD domain-containing protein [Desulfuromonas sp.]
MITKCCADIQLDVATILATISCDIGMPVVASEVLQLIDAGKSNAKSLSATITRDQALTLRVLKLANSPFYGFSRKVNTVGNAVVVLGEKILRNMVLALAVKGMHARHGEVERNLWVESASFAMAARFLSMRSGCLIAEEAFMAGLMSNVGELVCNNDKPQLYADVLQASGSSGQRDKHSGEIFPHTFAQYGAAILSHWNFSPLLVASCFYAENEDLSGYVEDDTHTMCSMVYLARQMCKQMKIGGYSQFTAPLAVGTATDALQLSDKDMQDLCSEFEEIYAEQSGVLLYS